MPCYRPVLTWRSKQVNASGKRSLVFSEHQGIDGTEMEIPCGGCVGCRLDKAGDWAVRLMHENKMHELSCMINLTYDNLHVPLNGSLDKSHFQNFMKRFRKKVGGGIRYFVCGEYGDENQRPHYHAIIYGYDFPDRKKHSKGSKGDQLWQSEELQKLWGMGQCTIGSVTHESCGYVARYIMKKINGEKALEHYARVDPATGEWYLLQPEYINMSTRPGIGHSFYERFGREIHAADSTIVKGTERPVPKYYDRLLARSNQDELDWLKHQRSTKARENRDNNTPERLAVREECVLARIRPLKREL